MGRVVRGLELQMFAAEGAHARLLPAYLVEQERMRCIRPEWRFAWMNDEGRIGSRVVMWGPPEAERPPLVDLVYDAGDGGVAALLAEALRATGTDGAEVAYLPDRPDSATRVTTTEPTALEAAGFALVATRTRFQHVGSVPARDAPAGVTIVTATDELLLPLLAASAVDSADRGTRDRDPARELRGLRGLEHDRTWWQVAKDAATGTPLGFVAPTRTPDGGRVIAMIGVAPAARGRGLGSYLLARGTASLRRQSRDARIIADVDDANIAMLKAAAAVGYQPFGGRAHYRRVPAGRVDAISLREITAETVRTICELTVRLHQVRFVAPNAVSLAQALFSQHAWYRAVYAGETPVGFAMLELVPGKVPYLWRFMIDGRFQGKGYGKEAIALLVAHVRSLGGTALELGVGQGEGSPQGFYQRNGFAPTGAFEEGELVMRREL
jgi:diamine N-acetyltransferase